MVCCAPADESEASTVRVDCANSDSVTSPNVVIAGGGGSADA
jgi:hypothetical protein